MRVRPYLGEALIYQNLELSCIFLCHKWLDLCMVPRWSLMIFELSVTYTLLLHSPISSLELMDILSLYWHFTGMVL